MKIKVTLKHKRTKKVRTEVMDRSNDPDCLFSYVGEVGNKSCLLDFADTGEVEFSIKAYEVIKVEAEGWVWKKK